VEAAATKLQAESAELAAKIASEQELAAVNRAEQLQAKALKAHNENAKVEAAAEKLQMEQRAARVLMEAEEQMAAIKRAEELKKVVAKAAAESKKVEAAALKLQAEAEARGAALKAKLDAAEERKVELLAAPIAHMHLKQQAHAARVEAAAEALLSKGADMTVKMAQAHLNHLEEIEKVAAKGAAEGAKVEAAKAKRVIDSEARGAALEAKLAAAAERKASVRYPPCARPAAQAKPSKSTYYGLFSEVLMTNAASATPEPSRASNGMPSWAGAAAVLVGAVLAGFCFTSKNLL
jgi:dTMP kinase